MKNSDLGNSTDPTAYLLYYQYIIYIGANSVHLILGFPTNVYVFWLIVNRGKVTSDLFALNLAVSDTLTCLSSLMFTLHYKIYSPQIESGPLWNTAVFFDGFIFTGRPLFQGCICFERYLAVIYPVTFLLYRSLRNKVWCCAVVWIVALGSCFAYWYETTLILNDYTLCLIVVTWSVMLFCCLAVLRALKRPRPGDGVGRDLEGMDRTKRRAFQIILTILVTTVIMYLPLTIFMIMYHFLEEAEFCFGMSVCFSVTIVTGFIEPLLYIHRAGKLPCSREPEEPVAPQQENL